MSHREVTPTTPTETLMEWHQEVRENLDATMGKQGWEAREARLQRTLALIVFELSQRVTEEPIAS